MFQTHPRRHLVDLDSEIQVIELGSLVLRQRSPVQAVGPYV